MIFKVKLKGRVGFIPNAGMDHLISEPKFKMPTSPPPLPANFNKFVKNKDKYDKHNLKAVLCLLELLVYIQLVTCTRLSRNAQFSYWFPLFTLFVEDL